MSTYIITPPHVCKQMNKQTTTTQKWPSISHVPLTRDLEVNCAVKKKQISAEQHKHAGIYPTRLVSTGINGKLALSMHF